MSVNDFFKTNFVLLERSATPDARGGETESWSVVSGSSYKGYLKTARANNRVEDKANNLTATHKHLYPIGIALANGNRIRRVSDSVDFDVIYPSDIHENHNKTMVAQVT